MDQAAILVVDDSSMSVRLFRKLLEHEGYRVTSAHSAGEARAQLATLHPDLILMDIQLPDMNGLDFARELKANLVLRDIPVVALTAHSLSSDMRKAEQAGCQGYILKPINPKTFGASVAKYIRR